MYVYVVCGMVCVCMLCAHMPSNMFVDGDDHDAYEGESEYEHSHRGDADLEDADESDDDNDKDLDCDAVDDDDEVFGRSHFGFKTNSLASDAKIFGRSHFGHPSKRCTISAPWQLWILIMSQLVSAHLENLVF